MVIVPDRKNFTQRRKDSQRRNANSFKLFLCVVALSLRPYVKSLFKKTNFNSMIQKEPIREVAKELGLVLKKNPDKQLLADKINELIQHDFQRLISILYRMDISETKLKLLLKEYPDNDAGSIIAGMMIERQEQKIKSRKKTRSNNEIPDEEKW